MTDRSEFVESCEYGRTLIHCQGRLTGAYWNLAGVVDAIESAESVRWAGDNFLHTALGHALEVREQSGQVWHFAVCPPAASGVTE